jgi:hypothetical protein
VTKRNPYERPDDVPLPFSEPAAARGRPGPKPRPDSLRSLTASGTHRWLRVAIPNETHTRLHIAALRRDTTASALVSEALERLLGDET